MDMKRNIKHQATLQKGTHILDVPIDQLLLDPNQPRMKFEPEPLAELAKSIESQGLQQLPVVNFAYSKDKKFFYYIKAGERRFRAHMLLKRDTMRCIVEEGVYDGTFDINRKLAQAAENSSREPHTHAEIVTVMEEVVKDELAKRSGKTHGVIEIAMGRVSQAFGRSRAWAVNYYELTHLHPELRDMLDSRDDEVRLNFSSAIALSRIPAEQQHELLAQAKEKKKRGGHALMYQFIVLQARALREKRGVAPRGRKPSDDKVALVRAADGLYRLAVIFLAERRSSEHVKHVKSVLNQMSTIEVDDLLHKLNEALFAFQNLQTLTKERRDVLYKGLRVVATR
jgi:ParB/RepB/Spo0J family partition protein